MMNFRLPNSELRSGQHTTSRQQHRQVKIYTNATAPSSVVAAALNALRGGTCGPTRFTGQKRLRRNDNDSVHWATARHRYADDVWRMVGVFSAVNR